MRTEALRKAQAEHRKRRTESGVRRYMLEIAPEHADVIAHFDAQPNKRQYLIDLIREDSRKKFFT